MTYIKARKYASDNAQFINEMADNGCLYCIEVRSAFNAIGKNNAPYGIAERLFIKAVTEMRQYYEGVKNNES